MTQWLDGSKNQPVNSVCLYYDAECGTPGSGFFMGGTSTPCAGWDFSEAALPRLVLRQREKSWQYLASSWAAILWADSCSEDKSGKDSDGMVTSKRNGDYTIESHFKSHGLTYILILGKARGAEAGQMSLKRCFWPGEMSLFAFRRAGERVGATVLGADSSVPPNARSIGKACHLLVIGKVCCGLILTHEALQDGRVCLCEVHQDQSVHHIAEAGIYIEAKYPPTQFQIMLQEDGNPRPVRFNVGDYGGELVEPVSHQFHGLLDELPFTRGAKRGPRLHHPRKAVEIMM